MNLDKHRLATAATARYPQAGQGAALAIAYLALGANGESAEVREKHVDQDVEGLRAELGDVLWYLARLHVELRVTVGGRAGDVLAPLPSEEVPMRSVAEGLDRLQMAVGQIAELAKKSLRDDLELTDARRTQLREATARAQREWQGVVRVAGLDAADVAGRNIAKLLDRRDRGTLSGSGDHR